MLVKHQPKGIDILSLEAKDIYMANMNDKEIGYFPRYAKGENKGKYNLKRFINTLDYSLDVIKLKEVYKKKYRNNRFTFYQDGHNYTIRVVNVTYKYSLSEYNKATKNVYVKLGYKLSDIEEKIDDCIYIENGEVIAVEVDKVVRHPIEDSVFKGAFTYSSDDCVYIAKNIPKVMSRKELREWTYENGFMCDGIKFVRFKRSSGSARVGKCLFIDEQLYPMMHKWECCGLNVKEGQEIDLAAWEAYISLTTSSIIDTLEIRPENILLIDDYESKFKDLVIETKLVDGHLITDEVEAEISNSIWDGQSLMDISLFGDYVEKGMLLLRNRFFKSCCFNTNLQDFFKNNDITEISQLNGITRAEAIEDIKLITTPSSIKYLKFGTFDMWLDNLDINFGIVKYEKPTHYLDGDMVQTHYQLLNTLQLSKEEMKEFLEPSFEFITAMRSDPDVLRYHIKYPFEALRNDNTSPLLTKNEIFYKMLGINNKFQYTKIYKDFLKETVKAFVKNMRKGHIFVEGNYSTICGNPIEMLMSSIGKFNGESYLGIGNIFTKRFDFGTEILASRSPHVSMGNVTLLNNVEVPMIDKYMNPTNEIVYVNSIGENLLMRLSGADFDSDTILITNNAVLINAARRNYDLFKVCSCNVESTKIKRMFTASQKSDLDFKTSGNLIGEIINLSQELNTLFWDRYNNGCNFEEIKRIYYDACQLNVCSMVEIDSAKKEFTFSNKDELDILHKKYRREEDDGRTIKPFFFSYIQGYKGYKDTEKHNYKKHDTSMDYLEELITSFVYSTRYKNTNTETLKFCEVVKPIKGNGRVNYEQVQKVIDLILRYNEQRKFIQVNENYPPEMKGTLVKEEKDKIKNLIGKMRFNSRTIYYLLRHLDHSSYSFMHRTLFDFLFSYPSESFFETIKESKEDLMELVKDEDGDIEYYGVKFKKTLL